MSLSGGATEPTHALDIDDLDQEMRENEPFRDVLTQYSHALLIHSMRMTGCTGLHTLEQRCSRWILSTLDVVVEDFQRHGMLRLQRGRVLIGDRKRLAGVSCDCYEVIRRNYEQVGR